MFQETESRWGDDPVVAVRLLVVVLRLPRLEVLGEIAVPLLDGLPSSGPRPRDEQRPGTVIRDGSGALPEAVRPLHLHPTGDQSPSVAGTPHLEADHQYSTGDPGADPRAVRHREDRDPEVAAPDASHTAIVLRIAYKDVENVAAAVLLVCRIATREVPNQTTMGNKKEDVGETNQLGPSVVVHHRRRRGLDMALRRRLCVQASEDGGNTDEKLEQWTSRQA
uniref:Uncharacterized protein n=1 Tax=Colletotrichum fructicola (strain Nara gc5) TaxID=1213859 RepID=L2G921_COLFN